MAVLKRNDRRVLVFTEMEKWRTLPFNCDLFSTGRDIANSIDGTLCAALLGSELSEVSHKIASFADEVYCVEHPLLDRFQPEFYAIALEQLCASINVDAIIMGHNPANIDVMARLLFRLGGELITDCIQFEIDPESKHALCAKPVYGAKALATFELERKPYLATMRLKPMGPAQPDLDPGKVIHFDAKLDESMAKVELIEAVQEDNVKLDKADAIVSGGRGVRDSKGVDQLKELSKALEKFLGTVEIGASRPLVDAQVLPSSRQIGLTGKKVAPEVYFAVGISGSLQHVTGVLGANKIVAINSDPEAPIFKYADYGVVGKYEDVIPVLIRKLDEL